MIILPAIVEGITTRRDKTFRLTVGTNELTPEVATKLFRLNQAFVFLAIKENDFATDEKKALGSLEVNLKDNPKGTPSQRLRNALYRLWSHKNEGFEEFNDYYHHKMENAIKATLNKIEQ